MQANNVTYKHENSFDIRSKNQDLVVCLSIFFGLENWLYLYFYHLSNEAKPPLSTPMTHVICSYSQNLQYIEIEQIFFQIYE